MTRAQTAVVHSVLEKQDRRSLIPDSFIGLLGALAAAWIAVGFVALILSFFSPVLRIAGASLFLAATSALGYQALRLIRAKERVLTEKVVPVLWDLARLVAWDPVEGVLFLHNKALSFVDDRQE
jgi:hypothetical protein